MKQDIFSKINRQSGETVPDGYFNDFRRRMKESLPERTWETEAPPQEEMRKRPFAVWNRIRPYAYMAAMFAGIWCMMNIFDISRQGRTDSVENSKLLLAALDNDSFVNDYIVSDVDGAELYDELYESGFDPSTLSDPSL